MSLIRSYLARHCQAAFNSLGQFTRSPFHNVLTCFMIAVALALPTGLYVILKNITLASQDFKQTAQFTVYFKKEATQDQVNSLNKEMQSNVAIAKIKLISPNQGLLELEKQLGLKQLSSSVADNPLPWAMVILPKMHSDEKIDELMSSLSQLAMVDNVQFDSLWMQRLNVLMMLGDRMVYLLLVFFSVAVLLIVHQTIRSATEASYHEIDVMRLIGGTNSFIRRPFLYVGALYGLIGGILAWELVDVFLFFIRQPVTHLSALYENSFVLVGLGWQDIFILLAGSLLLGFIGAAFAVTRYLAQAAHI